MYPQSDIPQITLIAHIDWFPFQKYSTYCLTSWSFVSTPEIGLLQSCGQDVEGQLLIIYWVFATNTAIIVFRSTEGMLIWAVPPLSPPSQPSDFYYLLSNNSTDVPPLFNAIWILKVENFIPRWMKVSSWYFEPRDSVYFDIIYTDSVLRRFKIIEPDFSDASLHAINWPEMISEFGW